MNQNQSQPQNDENTNNPPKVSLMGNNVHLIYDHGFWRVSTLSPKVICAFQHHFQARDTDIIIASLPKSGTTWLKALVFSIVNRVHTTQVGSTHPLLSHNPHELVPRLENGIYSDGRVGTTYPRPHHLDEMPSPRLFQSHLPYFSLAQSIKSSACKIVYISRNPLDVLVSQWKFFPNAFKNITSEEFKLPCIEDYFEQFCRGTIPFGPFFDHVLGYWKLSLERPDNVLFLKYEDLKDDGVLQVKRLAEFVGFPFSIEEENRGVIKEIILMCSIKNLKELDVNKSGTVYNALDNKTFFRKGEVGDWTNYFSPDMVERMSKLMEEKFNNTGLSFQLHPNQNNDKGLKKTKNKEKMPQHGVIINDLSLERDKVLKGWIRDSNAAPNCLCTKDDT